jgi:diaminopimelate decarboxylase
MKNLALPFDKAAAQNILVEYGSPLHVYDEKGLRAKAKKIKQAFSWNSGYKNYFAVKAAPTPAILRILHEEGMGFDCSSRSELVIMQKMGIPGEDIFYTSNNTARGDFELALELNATINLDDESQLETLIDCMEKTPLTRFAARYNPGELKKGNAIIGTPTEAKYGMDIETLIRVFMCMKAEGVQEFGLHTMVASNELDAGYFAETAEILLDARDAIESKTGITISFMNLGGGFGLNYKPDQEEFDVQEASRQISDIVSARRPEIQIFTENGRYVTGPHGYLITAVRYVMNKHKKYLGVDASMHNLMRPGMYGAYHHITVLGKENAPADNVYDVVGSLCENNDKFAIDRSLPETHVGDILVIHDAGAHGHAMGFNYNGLLRSAEILICEDGSTKLIRKAETVDQYLQNVIW